MSTSLHRPPLGHAAPDRPHASPTRTARRCDHERHRAAATADAAPAQPSLHHRSGGHVPRTGRSGCRYLGEEDSSAYEGACCEGESAGRLRLDGAGRSQPDLRPVRFGRGDTHRRFLAVAGRLAGSAFWDAPAEVALAHLLVAPSISSWPRCARKSAKYDGRRPERPIRRRLMQC